MLAAAAAAATDGGVDTAATAAAEEAAWVDFGSTENYSEETCRNPRTMIGENIKYRCRGGKRGGKISCALVWGVHQNMIMIMKIMVMVNGSPKKQAKNGVYCEVL